MSLINNLSAKQLRQAANLKEKIASLENELSQLLGSSTTTAAAKAPKKRRGMSAAGRARIVAAQKARWAKIHAAKSSVKAKPAKKRKMSAAARARLSKLAKARWARAKASGKKTL